MRICIIGGVFAKSVDYQRMVTITPETVLADGLRSRGHEVSTASHHATVRYQDFDVVHVHHLARGAVAAALDRSPTPLVLTTHSDSLSQSQRLAYGYVVRRSDALVDLSPALGGEHAGLARRHNVLHRVIPPGTPSVHFPARVPSPPSRGTPWRLLFVGQLIPIKRVDLLLRAVLVLSGRYSVHLDLVYHNDTDEARLRELARGLGVADCVTFRGGIAQEELATYYHRAHAVVLASDSEVVPSVLTEAMMCGTPVVATSVGGIADQVGPFGVLVRPGDALMLADGIGHLIDEFAHYRALATDMATTARERFSVEVFITRHEELYETLRMNRLKGSRRSRMASARSLPMRESLKLWSFARRRRHTAGE
jgi:glycosyltransferase involved in cell wall biosynthesis